MSVAVRTLGLLSLKYLAYILLVDRCIVVIMVNGDCRRIFHCHAVSRSLAVAGYR